MFKINTIPQDPLLLKLQLILEQAAEILRLHYQAYLADLNFKIYTKQDSSPVTQADLEVNTFIIEQLKQLTPDIPIISEETENLDRHQWGQCWLLDPLDGTKEFLAKREDFTINLSLIKCGVTELSAIMVPAKRILYIGLKNNKPFKYENDTWLEFDEIPEQKTACIGISYRSDSEQYQQFIHNLKNKVTVETITAGSAYKFCLMLEGKVNIYPRFHPTSEWDTSAGQGLLESIGGGLLTLDQKPFLYNQRSGLLNKGFIAFLNEKTKQLAFNSYP